MEAMEEHRSNETVRPPELVESPTVDAGDPVAESATPADLLADQVVVPPPQPAAQSSELPLIVLIEAGVTVFDGVLVIIFAVLWNTHPDVLLELLRGRGAVALMLGGTPMVLAAVISRQNDKSGTEMPGSVWARAGLIVGTLLCMMTVATPVLGAIREMLQPM